MMKKKSEFFQSTLGAPGLKVGGLYFYTWSTKIYVLNKEKNSVLFMRRYFPCMDKNGMIFCEKVKTKCRYLSDTGTESKHETYKFLYRDHFVYLFDDDIINLSYINTTQICYTNTKQRAK